MSASETVDGGLNDQVADALQQVRALVDGLADGTAREMAQLVLAHALSLAVYDAVHQQQQLYILRNAMTVAATRALLRDDDPEKARAYIEQATSDAGLRSTLAGLKSMLEEFEPSTRGAAPSPGRRGEET